MTLPEVSAASLVRAVTIAALATAAAPALLAFLQSPARLWVRRGLWTLLLLPLLAPPILVGYGWANASVRLVHAPLTQQAFYALLLLLRLTPAAVLVLAWSPRPAASPEAIHCHRLLGRRLPLALWLRGPARARLAAAAVVTLLAFSEFEIASLLGMRSWTVWLFDAQAGGLPLMASLRAAAMPVAIQAIIVAAAAVALWPRRQGEPQTLGGAPSVASPAAKALSVTWLAAALGLNVLAPAAAVLPGAWSGFGGMLRDLSIARDLRHSMLFAAAAALVTVAAVRFSGRWGYVAAAALCLPGLMGSLVVGLLVLAMFQFPVLHRLYDTPAPLLVALTLLLLPVGMVLGALLSTLGRGEPVHAAQLLASDPRHDGRVWAQRLAHDLVGRAWWGMGIVLFYLAYFDLPASSLLAPSGMTPAVVRLYNLMHYGRMAALSAMVVLTLALPLLLMLALACGHSLWMQARARWRSGPREPMTGATIS